MRTAVQHRLLFAILVLLLAPLALAQERLGEEQATALITAAAYLPGVTPTMGCGNLFMYDITVCAVADEGTSSEHVKSALEAHLTTVGIPTDAQEWGEQPRGWYVEWPATGGSISLSYDDGFIQAMYHPADPCADWNEESAYRWAQHAFGSSGLAEFGKINTCVGVDLVDAYGQTLLFYAISGDNEQTVDHLLRAGLNPNHRTHAGWTPLMYAARDASDWVVESLLEAGADPHLVAPDGTTAAQLAANNHKLGADVRAELESAPSVDPYSQRLAEAFVAELRAGWDPATSKAEMGCGLQPDRPEECFGVHRVFIPPSGTTMVTVWFHDAFALIDRVGARDALLNHTTDLERSKCSATLEFGARWNVDWYMHSDGTIHLYSTEGALREHWDDHAFPAGARQLGPICGAPRSRAAKEPPPAREATKRRPERQAPAPLRETRPRPIAVILDNALGYPQAGLEQASWIAELPIEGGATRLMAVFDKNDPTDMVGPVRGARSYFVEIAARSNSVLVHDEGSPDAMVAVGSGIAPSLNASRREDLFTRSASADAPNDVYATGSDLRRAASLLNVDAQRLNTDFRPLPPGADALRAERVTIDWSGAYESGFRYVVAQDRYRWIRNGQDAVDASGGAVQVDAVLVARIQAQPVPGDTAGRLYIPVHEGGPATLYWQGAVQDGTWSMDGGLRFTDGDGVEVSLEEITTWAAFVPRGAEVTRP